MDIGDTIAPKSDQQNYDDYLIGPRTVTVTGVRVTGGDQPVSIELAEYPGKPYKPNKSMRRVLTKVWGSDSSAYVGRMLTLIGNPKVTYGGKAVGGIEIAAMSHIDKPEIVMLTATRGRKKDFTVQPLQAPAQQPQEVPADVIETATKAHAEGNLEAYKQWLVDKNAPQHIIQAVNEIGSK